MSGTRPVPDVVLERYLLGELPGEQMEALRKRCEAEPDLEARVAALRAADAKIHETYGPAAMAGRIEARRRAAAPRPQPARRRPAGVTPWYRRPVFAAPAGLALACGLLLTVRPDGGPASLPETAEAAEAFEVRLKGSEAGLAIFRKVKGGTELLPPQSFAKAGDTLQVFYHKRAEGYGMVFSVDGSGAVTLHLPETPGPAATLPAGEMVALPHAYRLDKAPRLERFFLITSATPFECESMLARARASFAVRKEVPDSLEGLDEGFRQYPYTLRKAGAMKGAAR